MRIRHLDFIRKSPCKCLSASQGGLVSESYQVARTKSRSFQLTQPKTVLPSCSPTRPPICSMAHVGVSATRLYKYSYTLPQSTQAQNSLLSDQDYPEAKTEARRALLVRVLVLLSRSLLGNVVIQTPSLFFACLVNQGYHTVKGRFGVLDPFLTRLRRTPQRLRFRRLWRLHPLSSCGWHGR
jgi:hypothetical protein